MQKVKIDDMAGLQGLISEEWGGFSNPFEVTQSIINQFAELTGDKYFLHVDPEAAKNSPFGTTIAHGFLTLALMPQMKVPDTFEITDFKFMMNYGSNKLRFVGAVPSGSNIHMRSRVVKVEAAKGGIELTREFAIHVIGSEKPAVLYEMIIRYM
ncbi:MAG: MaoC family dehydratase [Sterolibacterium sp.]|nr:MaoC family dehydratase [Sterolibacterium sp.]